jgi:hypothetical protein
VTEPLIPTTVQASITWGSVDSLPVLAANHFAVQLAILEPGESTSDVILTVGYLSPPLLTGTAEDQRDALDALEHLAVHPIARFSIPFTRAAELARIIQELSQRIEAGGAQP